MTRSIAAILLLFVLITGAAATAPRKPLPVDSAFGLDVSKSGDRIEFRWQIADGYYLYRDHFKMTVDEQEVSFDVSEGVRKNDPGFGEVEVLYQRAILALRAQDGVAELAYQGCQENGICYRPEVRRVDLATLKVAEPNSNNLTTAVGNTEQASLADSGFVLAEGTDAAGTVLSDGRPFLIAISFLGFGLLLAFTPCVFPMYPIVLGMLGRGGENLGAGRGFILSTTYVLGLATAFGLVGALVGWTGQNIQFALQSPLTTVAMAVLFLVLALGSFGVFELQLPRFITSRVATSSSSRSSSLAQAATLGVTSSLIVGPCVTAPLAGALLYIGQGGDWRIGAMALFMLGLGKGLPLIMLATVGSGLLPKAGVWMETVRRLFGFAFIAMAIWIATPLLPDRFNVAMHILVGVALAIDFVRNSRKSESKLLLAATVLVGIEAVFAMSGADVKQAQARIVLRSPVLTFHEARSSSDLVRQAKAAGAPMLVYVTADWCVVCRTIERSVLTDPRVITSLQRMHLVKLDVTKFDPTAQSVLAQLKAVGPPTMIFFDRSMREPSGTRLIGSVSAQAVVHSAEIAAQ